MNAQIGDLIADKVTAAMATWTFIIVFLVACLLEIQLNHTGVWHFDPQTIILNLFLSLVAAIQGSIIMISQNRQATRDRHTLEHVEQIAVRLETMETQLVQAAKAHEVIIALEKHVKGVDAHG